jgi:hypothetical protein
MGTFPLLIQRYQPFLISVTIMLHHLCLLIAPFSPSFWAKRARYATKWLLWCIAYSIGYCGIIGCHCGFNPFLTEWRLVTTSLPLPLVAGGFGTA